MLAPCQPGCILCTAAGVPQTGLGSLLSAPRGRRSPQREGGVRPPPKPAGEAGRDPARLSRPELPSRGAAAWGRDRACGFPPLAPCLRRVSPSLPERREAGPALGAPSSRAWCRSGPGREEDRVPVGTRLGRPSPTRFHRPHRLAAPAVSPTVGLWGHPGEGRACRVPLPAPLRARGGLGC